MDERKGIRIMTYELFEMGVRRGFKSLNNIIRMVHAEKIGLRGIEVLCILYSMPMR